ncbi:MAG: phosphoglycolate phosphatase [Frankiaceae bacterium]|nr:phosphoglycolate phosphatase [Frankiaceae bacterium]
MSGDIRVIYSDLDGTMVGPRGCFFRGPGLDYTLEPARALVEMHQAGIALVLVSGRSLVALREISDVFGAEGFIGELGGIVGASRGHLVEVEVLRGAMPADINGSPVDAMLRAGVLELLQDRWPQRLQLHDPWHEGHQVDLLLRGDVPVDDANALLAEHGFGWLRLHDNGISRGGHTFAGLDTETIRFYHLLPDGISKAIAIEADLRRRGLRPDQAIAIGDSVSDMAMAPYVGRLFMVANGAAAYTPADNVVLTAGAMGEGWAEAVRYAAANSGRRRP